MIERLIPLTFIQARHELSWKEMKMGVSEGWLESADALDLARTRMTSGSTDSDLRDMAALCKDDAEEIRELLTRLASRDHPQGMDELKLTWLRIILAWVYSNRNRLEDPLETLEGLYADFGYPDEISHLVRFNVVEDSYRPQDHSHEENVERLMKLWQQYTEEVMPRRENARSTVTSMR